MKKGVVLIVLCLAILAVPGLLRLNDGQIQEQQEDGSWKCVDQIIREIVQTEGLPSIADITSSYEDITWDNTESLPFILYGEPHSWGVEEYIQGDYPATYFEILRPVYCEIDANGITAKWTFPANTKFYFENERNE